MTRSDVVFYDFDFNRLGIFGRYVSVNWTVAYCDFGTIEVHFPKADERILKILSENSFLLLCQEDRWAIVTSWQVEEEDIGIFGRTPEWLMTKRAVNSPSLSQSTAEEFSHYVVQTAMGDFVTLDGKIGSGEKKDFAFEGVRTAYDLVKTVLGAENLGFRLRVSLSKKALVFEVYSGKEYSTVISPSTRTASNMVFKWDIQDMATESGWYERVSETTGEREWTFINEGAKDGMRRWDAILTGVKTDSDAALELKKKTVTEEIETDVRRLAYGKNFDLGDVLRVQFEANGFGRTIKKRLTSVDIFYDADSFGVRPVFK